MPNEWAQVVERTESQVVRKKSLHIPKDPVGTNYAKSCVRLVFNIDKNGVPINIRIDHSSRNRILDLAAKDALKHYRFKPLPEQGHETLLSLVFWSD
ncbi:energy transducer TonB [Rhodanobacter sp. UC4451_H18]